MSIGMGIYVGFREILFFSLLHLQRQIKVPAIILQMTQIYAGFDLSIVQCLISLGLSYRYGRSFYKYPTSTG